MIGSPSNPGRFIGYTTLPYQDWVNRQLMQYVSQRNVYGEGGYADPWMASLTGSLGSPEALNQAVQGIGGYGAIGFDPNSVYNQQAADYAQTGYNISRDANGNVVIPMFNYDSTGHLGPISIGGSEGENVAELGKVLLAALGGAAAGGAGAGASSTAGFGEAGYAGAAAGSGAGAAAGSGAGYDFGMTGNEGAATGGGAGAGSGGGLGGGGATVGEDSGAGFDFGLTGDEAGAFPASDAGGAASSSIDWGSLLDNAVKYKGLLGTALGALIGGSSAGSKPAGTTTTTQDVPAWLMPYVQGNLDLGALVRAGLLNSPSATAAARGGLIDTINGKYLDPATNPYLDATYKHAAGLVGADVDSRFEKAGRYGSGAHQGVLQEGLNNLATNIYGGNYQQERARQAAAITGAPTFDTGAAGAGYAPLSGFADLFPGQSRATTSPYFANTLGGILSGALAGGALARAV